MRPSRFLGCAVTFLMIAAMPLGMASAHEAGHAIGPQYRSAKILVVHGLKRPGWAAALSIDQRRLADRFPGLKLNSIRAFVRLPTFKHGVVEHNQTVEFEGSLVPPLARLRPRGYDRHFYVAIRRANEEALSVRPTGGASFFLKTNVGRIELNVWHDNVHPEELFEP